MRRRGLKPLALLASMAIFGGCGTRPAGQALEKQYKDNPQLQRATLAKFAGKVTVDGNPPGQGAVILVILNDPKTPSQRNQPRQYTACAADGTFEFSTNLKGDGTLVGSYVVTFVELHPHGNQGYLPPDELKNLYNDPDKNATNPEFHVELTPPGKTDYAFALKLAGEHSVDQPGAKATTEVH